MSEFLHNNPESSEESDASVKELAMQGLSRVVNRRNSDTKNGGKEDEEYNDERDYEDGDYGDEDDERGEDNSYDDYNDEDDGRDEDDYDDEDDDGYYSEDEERHYGELREKFNEEKLTLQEIPLPAYIMERYSFLNELPHGVAVMGGVARSVAREIITGEREPIRDIDLVNILDEDGNSEVDAEILDALSSKYMPDDYSFGHGIKDEHLRHYFSSRDFTINQSLIMDGKFIVSDLAYNDFQENIIRPTFFELPYDGDEVGGRLFLKALMMRSVLLQISDSIPLIEDMERPEYIGPFNTALFLNKAMSRGAKTARNFTKDLVEWDIVPKEYAGRPIALAKALHGQVYAFEFRPSTDERFRDVAECSDMDGYFVPPSMLRYHASDPVIRQAIAEYEDGLNDLDGIDGVTHNGEERISGHYTQAEYDAINLSND